MSTGPTGGAPRQERVALWDNARWVLIALVVVGHTVSTVRTGSAAAFGLYVGVYLFHMPAMILLSGMFSKAETSPKAVRSTVQLLVTWLLWEGIWALIHLGVEGAAPGRDVLVSPAWTLWFLVTLATMRILLPFLARLRHPLLWSVALALASGLSPAIGTDFSASRTLAFLPFFVGGWLIRERGWLDGPRFTRPSPALRGAAWALLAAVAATILGFPRLREEWRVDRWLTWRDAYAELFERAPLGSWQPEAWPGVALGGVAVAAALLALAAAMTLALLVVVPRARGPVTAWGTRTLAVYLLHGPIVWVLRQTGAIDRIDALGWVGLPVLVLIAVALAALLSAGWVSRAAGPLVRPPVDRLLRRVAA